MARDKSKRPVVALSVAASDSGGGAGIQADLLTFAAHRVHGATVITAVTAQNTRGVARIEPVSERLLAAQLDAVFSDLHPAAVKIGVLHDTKRLRVVVRALRRWRARDVVLDPVLAASTGESLLSRSAIVVLRRELLPLCDLVTPNLPEAEALTGIRIRSEADRRLAARMLANLGAKAVLVTGGHDRGRIVSDLLFDGRLFCEYRHPRISSRATHGTGCTLSSAITANLALGRSLHESIERAILYLRAGLVRGLFPGRGPGVPDRFPGPMARGPGVVTRGGPARSRPRRASGGTGAESERRRP